jgi:hypothetical protein
LSKLPTVIGDIKRHLENVPFVPFTIRMTDGREYPVPTLDHIYFPPVGSRVVVSDDQGYIIALPSLHMSGIAEWPETPARKKRRR